MIKLLFNKLLNIHLPVYIISILVYWYSRLEIFIRCSTKFRVTNGVRQGGILSPAFFNVYMNNLSVSLDHSGIGSSLGGNLIIHLCYVDDLCLIALSLSGMQCLLDSCDKYAPFHQLTNNATKSLALCFKQKHIRIDLPYFVSGKHVIPAVDKCQYLKIIDSEANCDGDLKM